MGVGSGHPLESESQTVKMAGTAQKEETFCHKHVLLSLNTDGTEVPITCAECVSSAGCVLIWA